MRSGLHSVVEVRPSENRHPFEIWTIGAIAPLARALCVPRRYSAPEFQKETPAGCRRYRKREPFIRANGGQAIFEVTASVRLRFPSEKPASVDNSEFFRKFRER
jgi:hypothetical protein